jgi:hypothetical protein
MSIDKSLVPVERIEERIYMVRGQRVMLDADVARVYGVSTKRLNEQVKRNSERFPDDFAFRLTAEEATILRSQIATSSVNANRSQFVTGSYGGRRYLPYVFTEHGAIMAATVLNSPRAVAMSVYVVRAFVRLRQTLSLHKDLAHQLAELEHKIEGHDESIRTLFEAIRQLMMPPEPPRKQIGFHVEEGKAKYAVNRKR